MYFRIPIIASLVALAFSAASHAYTYHADDFEDLMVRDADLAFDTYFETRDLDEIEFDLLARDNLEDDFLNLLHLRDMFPRTTCANGHTYTDTSGQRNGCPVCRKARDAETNAKNREAKRFNKDQKKKGMPEIVHDKNRKS